MLDRLLNAGVLLTRILSAVEAVRDLALWLSPAFGGGQGRGPLAAARAQTVPTVTRPAPRASSNPAAPAPASTGTLVTDLTEFEEIVPE